MKVIHRLDLLKNERSPVMLAAGFFDGVHMGHQKIVRRVVVECQKGVGTAWVMTFDTHPMKILHPDKAPSLLTSTPHKLNLLKSLGVEGCVIIPFTRSMARLHPELFIDMLFDSAPSLRSLFIGQSWRFGRNGRGTPDMLKQSAKAHGIKVRIIPDVSWKGKPVSSTRVRRNVITGNLEDAARMLGRPFSVLGTVTQGRKIGTSIGTPTANLDPHNEVYPPNGVYAVRGVMDTRTYPGVVNLGTKPTLKTKPNTERVLEVHLFDIRGDLYKKDIEVCFLKKLRNERRFSSIESLKDQIAKDIEQARHWLGRLNGKPKFCKCKI